ncbi:MAG TPA: PEP-CTERM sorting domain-containing protein [Deltaproteobacteria bacterium]|nr:PEP-CTERM sorting domain-containing protein [Deltaproteobacteria bacterium]
MRHRLALPVSGFILFLTILLVGAASQAASLANGFQVQGAAAGCSASGNSTTGSAVSGGVTEGDCVLPTGFAGTFSLTGSSSASYGTVHASANVSYAGVDVPPSGSAGANAGARFSDTITIDKPGRTGEIVDLVFESAINGNASAAVSGEGGTGTPFSRANASLSVSVAGAFAGGSVSGRSDGTALRVDPDPVRVAITLGEAFSIEVNLQVSALIGVNGGSSGNVSGFASAAFGNSAGITSFSLFDAAGVEITDFSVSSESGQFALYQPVPEPGSALLVGLGLLGLPLVQKRRPQA